MRDKGEGTIYQRKDGLWVARLELPPQGGKRRRKQVTATTKAAALVKLREAKKQLEAHGDIHTDTLTVKQWMDRWHRDVATQKRPGTSRKYEFSARWVSDTIGTVRLDSVTTEHVRRVLTAMEGAGLSSGYRRTAHTVMKLAFRMAEREGRMTRNPAEKIDAPAKNTVELDVLTTGEAKTIIQSAFHTDTDVEPYLWATFLLTGARMGEVLGLEWDRVTDVLDLSWQLQELKAGQTIPRNFEYRHISGQLYWTRPKSRSGWRIIPLVDPLRGILARLREQTPDNPWGLVFTRVGPRVGRVPIRANWAREAWAQRLADAEIEKSVRPHDLRHTTVDMLYEAGVPEDVIQEIVGHSAVSMTRSYKSRANRPRLTDAMRLMSEHLGFKALE